MKIEYLLFNGVVFFGPLILYFLRIFFVRLPPFNKAFPAIAITALLFLIWDWLVIGYFWTFNEMYITGIRLFNIPVEEILFFLTVPYSCLFLWENIREKKWGKLRFPVHLFIILFSSFLLVLVSHLTYTFVVLSVYICVVFADWIFKINFYREKIFLFFLGIVLLLTLITNGYLTARPVVFYNESVKTNILVTSIPIEDFIYGIALISLVIILYEKNIIQKNH